MSYNRDGVELTKKYWPVGDGLCVIGDRNLEEVKVSFCIKKRRTLCQRLTLSQALEMAKFLQRAVDYSLKYDPSDTVISCPYTHPVGPMVIAGGDNRFHYE